jgi:hypothetical protein
MHKLRLVPFAWIQTSSAIRTIGRDPLTGPDQALV